MFTLFKALGFSVFFFVCSLQLVVWPMHTHRASASVPVVPVSEPQLKTNWDDPLLSEMKKMESMGFRFFGLKGSIPTVLAVEEVRSYAASKRSIYFLSPEIEEDLSPKKLLVRVNSEVDQFGIHVSMAVLQPGPFLGQGIEQVIVSDRTDVLLEPDRLKGEAVLDELHQMVQRIEAKLLKAEQVSFVDRAARVFAQLTNWIIPKAHAESSESRAQIGLAWLAGILLMGATLSFCFAVAYFIEGDRTGWNFILIGSSLGLKGSLSRFAVVLMERVRKLEDRLEHRDDCKDSLDTNRQ